MSILHDPPALSGEFHAVTVKIVNEEDAIESGVISLVVEGVGEAGRDGVTGSQRDGFYADDFVTPIKEIQVSGVGAGEVFVSTVYVISINPNPERSLLISFQYNAGLSFRFMQHSNISVFSTFFLSLVHSLNSPYKCFGFP